MYANYCVIKEVKHRTVASVEYSINVFLPESGNSIQFMESSGVSQVSRERISKFLAHHV